MNILFKKTKELLYGGFGKAKEILKDSSKINDLLLKAEERLKKVPYVGNKLSEIPTLLSMLNDWLHKRYTDISIKTLITIVSAILYFVLPIDFILDGVPILGLLDDTAVIGLCCQMVSPDINKYKEWQKRTK